MAANALASNIQQINVRKVAINAKVTFVIWILETISLIVVFVVWIIFQMKELTTTLIFLFLYVAIPLTFLMNTSENKDRLANIEILDIVRNTFCFSKKPISEPNQNVSTINNKNNDTSSKIVRSHQELEKWADVLQLPMKRPSNIVWNRHIEMVLPDQNDELRSLKCTNRFSKG